MHAFDANTLALWRLNDAPWSSILEDIGGNYPLERAAGLTLAPVANLYERCLVGNGALGHAENATAGPVIAAAMLGEWTVECWLQLPAAAGGTTYYVLFGVGAIGETLAANYPLNLMITGGTNRYLRWQWEYGAGSDVLYTGTYALPLNRWFHFALRKQQNGTVYDVTHWVDGVMVQQWLSQRNAEGGTSSTLRLFNSADGTPFSGQASDFRLSGVARSDAEITANAAADLTLVTRPFGSARSFSGCSMSNVMSLRRVPRTGRWKPQHVYLQPAIATGQSGSATVSVDSGFNGGFN